MDNRIDIIEEQWESTCRVIADVLDDTYEPDWMPYSNCLTETTDFIRKPDEVTERRWRKICKQCPVALQCLEWADREQPTGVFIAGEWREDEGL